MTNIKEIRYLNQLLKVELGQRTDKSINLSKEEHINKVSKVIGEVIEKQQVDQRFVLHLPNDVEKRVFDKSLLQKITREITANEIMLILAVVSLAQKAYKIGKLDVWEIGKKALLKTSLSEIYQEMGLDENSGKKDRDLIKNTLTNISFKQYLLTYKGEYYNDHLIKNRKGTSEIELEISTLIFDFDTSKPTYFKVPANFNSLVKEGYKQIGRGIKHNPQSILFVKQLYQSKYITQKNGIDTVEYSYDKLEEILKLDNLIKNKHQSRIQPLINRTFQLAKNMNLIVDVEEFKENGKILKYTFYFTK